jgi:hypothetical protein
MPSWSRPSWRSSASRDRPLPTLTTPLPSMPNTILTFPCFRHSLALAWSSPPGCWSPSANNVNALRPLPHCKKMPASRRSRHAAASTPGSIGACNVPRSSDKPLWSGQLHPSVTPSGHRSITSNSATEVRDIRLLCGPWPFKGSGFSLGVGRIARRMMNRSISRRLPTVAHHCSTI